MRVQCSAAVGFGFESAAIATPRDFFEECVGVGLADGWARLATRKRELCGGTIERGIPRGRVGARRACTKLS